MPPQSSAVATRQPSVKSLVESDAYKGRLNQVLGNNAPQFVSSLVQISQSWNLVKADPHSVIAAAMTAATLDLPIDKNLGFAHIVPYGKDQNCKAQLQIGYKGFIQLGLRSGQFKRLNVTVVYEGELVSFDRVRAEAIIDQDKAKSDKVIGYIAYMQLTNGFEHSEYWTGAMVERHAKRYSQAYKGGYETPWSTNFDGMAKKTVLKAMLALWAPMSIQMNKALVEDQAVHTDVDSEVTYPDNEPPQEKPQFDGPTTPTGKEEGKKGKGSKPTVEVDTTVKKADPDEAAAGLAPMGEPKEGATEPGKELPDLDHPYDSLKQFAEDAGVTEKQITTWAKANKNSHETVLAGSKVGAIMDMREDSVKYILVNWADVLPLIKQVKAD